MRRLGLLIITLFVLLLSPAYSQISYGGKPLPFILTRSGSPMSFEQMPAFDQAEELRLDSLNNIGLRGSYRFAYKFMTDLSRENAGTTFTLADGTKVWRLGIRSEGALSLNVLFTEFEIPEGARLFLYNPDQSHVLGSYTHRNNSDLGIFPVSPVEGDELIIEYQEPPGVDFPGILRVGEVNHGYRSLRNREPSQEYEEHYCMPVLACFPDDELVTEELGRSVVVLIIDGTNACSGVMINNTEQDGAPYILTASHCINKNFYVTDPQKYIVTAGSIICFFNYDSPACSPVMRGAEEMSMSSTYLRAINEYVDMALLELKEIPPVHYRPYYAGWELGDTPPAPYFCIQHPKATVKKVSWLDTPPAYATFDLGIIDFIKEAHWKVDEWTAGSTDTGSSGSPLFNGNGRVIGGLSGGYSSCESPKEDYFFALSKAWEPLTDTGEMETIDRQLKHWLDPADKAVNSCNGFDPYGAAGACIRLSNVRQEGNQEKIFIDTIPGNTFIPLYGNATNGINVYAEAYHVMNEAVLYGTYIVSPAVGRDYKGTEVEIVVYEGDGRPERLIHSEVFQPTYMDYSRDKQVFEEKSKPLSRDQESFISFSEPVTVNGDFFVGYKIKGMPEGSYFTAFNVPAKYTVNNTAWFCEEGQWKEATEHAVVPQKTSLYIDPVIQPVSRPANPKISSREEGMVIVGADRKTIHVMLPENVEKGRLTIVSMQGKVVEEYVLNQNQSILPVETDIPGVYLLKINCCNKQLVYKVVF